MPRPISAAFAAVIAAQASHSIEEYVFRLYDRLAPARFISSLFSSDLSRGFAVANTLLVLAGIACYFVVRCGRPAARGVVWFWAVLEILNGCGHLLFAIAVGGYFPGAATAPLLIASAAYLIARLSAQVP
jgi:hypothetical protein